nr:MAG TPA: hypothetical protein [Crassvirales sp.]
MNRQQAKELLPVIQAFAEGKTIEFKNAFENWTNCNEVLFNYPPKDYRIKLEPKYRPFNDAEECWQEMLKHQPFGWLKDDVVQLYNIINIKTTGITVNNGISNCNYSFKSVFNLTFFDGTPFGVEE